MTFNVDTLRTFISTQLAKVSSDTIGWLAIVFAQCATIPPILGLLFGISDKLPSLDVVVFLWTSLVMLFVKALINKDTLIIITISLGFMIQAGLMGFLIFK